MANKKARKYISEETNKLANDMAKWPDECKEAFYLLAVLQYMEFKKNRRGA